MRTLENLIGKKPGGSTGTNLWGSLILASEMIASGQKGAIVTLLCDPGERYLDTYYNDEWLKTSGYDIKPFQAKIERFSKSGLWAD